MSIFVATYFGWTRSVCLVFLLCLSVATVNAQTTNFTKGTLSVDVTISNPCGGSTTNGTITFKVKSADGGSATLVLVALPTGGFDFPSQVINVGTSFVYSPPVSVSDQAGQYDFVIHDALNDFTINTQFPVHTPVTMTDLPAITFMNDPGNNLANGSCSTPDGKVAFTILGGSQMIGAGKGSYTYSISKTPSTAGFPLTGTYDGTTTLDIKTLYNLANPGSPITGLNGAVYTAVITDNYSVCGATTQWTVTDPSPIKYDVAPLTNTICLGSTANVTLSNSEGSNVSYQVFKDGVSDPNVPAQTGTGSMLTFTVPASPTDLTPAGTYTFTIQAINGSCTPAFMNFSSVVTVTSPPTTAAAGGPQTICSTGTATLAANTPVVGTGAWSVQSGPSTLASQFSSTSNPTAIFTPVGGAGSYVLTWTISNAPCTPSTSNVTITVNAPPSTSVAGPPQSICANASATLAANIPAIGTGAWSVQSGPSTLTSQFSSTVSPTATFTPAGGAGSYVLLWTISNAPCTASTSTVTISVTAAPTTANAGVDKTICSTGSLNLAANTAVVGTGAWSVSSGPSTLLSQFNNPASPTSKFTPAGGAGSYVLTWTISNAPCTPSADDVTITVNPPPSTSIAGPPQSICSNSSATLAANTPAIGIGVWTVQSGPSTSTAQLSGTSNPTATFTPTGGAGNYVLKWTITNAPCTASSSTVTITVSDPPTTSNAGTDQSLCNVTTTTLAGNTPVIGTGVWTVVSGAATITTASSPTSGVTGLTIGASATLRWTISNGACAPSTDDVIITVASPPTTSVAGPDQSVCGAATLAANTPVSGAGAWSVQSGPSTLLSQFSSTSNPTATFTPAGGAGIYVLTWTISNAPCTASASNVTITVSAAPTISNAGSDQTICSGSATLTANIPVVGTGAWTVASGPSTLASQFSSTTNPTATFTPAGGAGTYQLTWTITNAPCTPSTSNVNIIVAAAPTTSNAGSNQTICATGSATLAANIAVVGTGAWSVQSGPSTLLSQFSSTSNPTATFTPAAGAGNYVLTWTISNAPCTASTSNVTITVNGAPTVSNAGGNQTICASGSATLAANTPAAGTGLWSVFSGPSTLVSQFSSTSNPMAAFTPTGGAGIYILTWTISNAPCTPSTSNVTINVDAVPTTSNAGPDQSLCNVITATLAGNIPTTGTGMWSVVSGAATVTTPTSPTSGVTGLTIGASATLRWTISNGTCTASTDDIIISVSALPTSSNAGSDQEICTTGSAVLAANVPAVGTGAWSVQSGPSTSTTQFSSTSNPTATFTPAGGAGNYVLTWTISNASCPASASNVTINVDAVPSSANAGADQGVCGSSTSLTGNTPAVGNGAWSIISGAGGAITTPSSPTSVFTGTVGTAYTLRWTIGNGVCAPSTDDVNIIFSTPPTTANAGPDQALCGISTNLAGNTPAAGSGTWSIISGAGGSVTTPSSPTSAFTGTSGNSYTLRWTIANGACTPSTDDVTVTFDQAPTTAAAGSDQSTCGTSTTLAANTPIVGTGSWSIVSGAGGSITTPSSPTSAFTGTSGTTYVLRWTISNGSCTPSTDDVSITFDVAPTTADAGLDQDLCNVTTTTLAGNTPVTGAGLWSIVSGTATITTPSSPASGVTGLVTGSATLRWTISNGGCPASTDDVVINVSAPPTVANAGPDQTPCGPATLAANVPAVGTGAWSVVSGVGGTFFDVSSPTSTFSGNPGVTYVLRWTISNGACTATTDDVSITFDVNSPTPSNAGSDQNNCGTSVTLAANTPVVGTGAWSIVSGAGGSIANTANPASGFTGVQGSNYTLRWTITSGACTPSTDDVVITFDQSPTIANAGPDQTLCNTNTTLAANTPAIGTGAWSIVSGAGGSFANASDPLSGFTGTQGTTYVLRWTISNGGCTASTDDVSTTLDQAPTASAAGADQSVCNTSATMAANTPVVGTGLWTIVSGAGGSFVDATDPATTFNGTQGTVYVLRWTISNGTCVASTDDVSITLDQTPTVADAGLDQTPCGPTALAANAPVVGTGLWSVVSGAGGSFSDTTSPTSTFSGTAGTTYTLRWTISNGSCTSSTDDVQIQFDPNTPTTSNAGPDQDICGTSATLAANTPVVGTGAWSIVSGAGGAIANTADPLSGFTGTAGTVYALRWTISSIGGCTPSTDDVQITFDQGPTTAAAGVDQSGCNTTVTLSGNTPLVGSGSWSIISGAGGSIANASNPTSGFTGASGNTYTLRWTISSGGCTASSDDVTIIINPAGSCVVVGGTCATVVVAPKPSPATCTISNGGIVFSIKPFVPAVNNVGVIIGIKGVSNTNLLVARTNHNDSTFTLLPVGTYSYSIVYGDSSCILYGQVTIDQSGTVGTPIATNIVDAPCYGTASGAMTLDVPGETGNSLEWSLDGILWTQFIAGNQITGIPAGPAPTFQRVISVRRNSSDPCNAQVTITIKNATADIQATSAIRDASCANNDGSIQITSVTGGTGTGTYTYQLDGVAKDTLTYDSLPGGSHIFTVTDSNSCVKNFPLTINFPGLVNFTTQTTAPDCSGTGTNGSIVATITSSGTFDIGVTTDPLNDPSVFQNVVSAGNTQVTFPGLSQGNYYVVAKPTGALCPSRSPIVTISGGPFAVDFNYSANNFVCFEDKGTVDVFGIKGSLSVDYSYEIINSGNIVQSGTISQLQALDTVLLTGLDKGSYQIHLYQDQSVASGCVNPISSDFKNFSIDGSTASLDTLYVIRKYSQTNVPTGSMLIGISESQEPSYQIKLHLLDAKRAGQQNLNLFDSVWVTATRNNTDNNIEFDATGLYAGDYRLYIRDTLGCTKTYDLSIDYDRGLFIPNIFTPNNDNKNDAFEILNLPDKSSIIITNRWGKQVYSSSNLKVGPDGITTQVWNGGAESDGIYYYTLNAGGKTYTGWVEMIHPTTD